MSNDILVPLLAVITLTVVGGLALWQRNRVAQLKGDTKRSAFTEAHGGAPRPNRTGTEH